MCSGKAEDIDDWRDLNKLREEVEAQKARVEHLQAEQKWMKNSFSASDLCGKMRLDRSDSGIDRQSLIMDSRQNHETDSTTNVISEECSTNSIKKIIEITSLIRAIEQQLNITKTCSDTESMKTYSSTCSMPRCFHEVPEQGGSGSYWIQSQLVACCIEQEKLNKQLSHSHNQIFKIENVKIPTLLNGITADQLKKRIDEYYKLKACLTELAASPTCNSTAMITVVRQLEPIAQGVEHYFKLSQELINLQNQISVIVDKKNILQRKRSQLLNILQTPQKPKSDVIPQSASWNEPSQCSSNPWSQNTFIPRNILPHDTPWEHNLRESETRRSNDEIDEFLQLMSWPPFNGDGIAEEDPPPYDENFLTRDKKVKSHNRSLCHQYVNDDVIRERDNHSKDPSIELIVSSFPYESITIVQVKRFKLLNALQSNQQYRARLSQLNGEGSDWNTICVSEDGKNVSISPHILLPIKWSFSSHSNLTLLLELQLSNKGFETTSNCFMFNILPQNFTQKISVPLHTVQTRTTNYEDKPNSQSVVADQSRVGSLKLPPRTSTYNDILFSSGRSGFEELPNFMLSRNGPPVHHSNIRRSQTYSHDHQYCGKFECCSSIDFVSEPVTKNYLSQYFNFPQSVRNQKLEPQFTEESGCSSSHSSFKRQSTFRQPIRLKRNPRDPDFPSDMHSQGSDQQSSDVLIQELWFVVCDLYLALNSCTTSDERLLQFAYFRTRCPTNLMKLYDYFVETIFDPDHK